MPPEVQQAIEKALGARVLDRAPVSGGDVNEAHRLSLSDGRCVFVKTNRRAPAGLFAAEAHGLAWLAQPGALRVPEVLACSGEGEPAFLVLEHLASGRRRPDFDESLGRGLAALHRASPGEFGLSRDNFIGRLPQLNRALPRWADFYRERRLLPQLELSRRSGRSTKKMERLFERLFARLEELVGESEPPSRLHGDLWGGNLMVDEAGAPALVDPAAYGGHREVDLAMMRLFGGFSERVFDSYAEAHPLAPGAARRVELYQLYPIAVHVNHFGGPYASMLERALERLV